MGQGTRNTKIDSTDDKTEVAGTTEIAGDETEVTGSTSTPLEYHLQITPKGEIVGRERKEPRFSFGGVVFLHCPDRKPIRAIGRDLSIHGIGIEIHKKLKSYQVGSRLALEFAQPHHLEGMLIEVELRRVQVDHMGNNHVGFKILEPNRLLKKKINELIVAIERSDPWAY